MERYLSPLLKKSIIFSMIAFPLITISVFNLIYLLTTVPINRDTMLIIGVLAVLGAIGMALFKESMHHNRSLQQQSFDFIKSRIQQSEVVPEQAIVRYIRDLDTQPSRAYQTFQTFLQHEERLTNYD
ncbi:arginine exporter protein ArgO [Alkalibacillus flavidus]|uniref:Arginine exporter protein ArgO n=2 Tax=Alkalibacillus flavidus TaxID=546021 RepID=A0ABV2KX17_9BACI